MTKALIYKPSSKSQVVAAFTAAAAIHLSAVAFAFHHQETADISFPPYNDIDIEPGMVEPATPPEETEHMELPNAPPTEFFDTSVPPRRVQKSVPIRAPGMTTARSVQLGSGKPLAVRAPRPEYPYEARKRHMIGSGVVDLDVDPTTGSVINAHMTQSTGSSILDDSALSAFRRWRFKPGTTRRVRIPITFAMNGVLL